MAAYFPTIFGRRKLLGLCLCSFIAQHKCTCKNMEPGKTSITISQWIKGTKSQTIYQNRSVKAERVTFT